MKKNLPENVKPERDDIPEVSAEEMRAAIRSGRGRYAGRFRHPLVARVWDSEGGTTPDQAVEVVVEPPAEADSAA